MHLLEEMGFLADLMLEETHLKLMIFKTISGSMGMIKHVHYVSVYLVYLHLWLETCPLLYERFCIVLHPNKNKTLPQKYGKKGDKTLNPVIEHSKDFWKVYHEIKEGSLYTHWNLPWSCFLETPKNIPQQTAATNLQNPRSMSYGTR